MRICEYSPLVQMDASCSLTPHLCKRYHNGDCNVVPDGTSYRVSLRDAPVPQKSKRDYFTLLYTNFLEKKIIAEFFVSFFLLISIIWFDIDCVDVICCCVDRFVVGVNCAHA